MASQDYATPSKSIDAQALINDAPLSKYQWMIAIICFLIIFTDGIDTAAMGFICIQSFQFQINRCNIFF
ncbi:hypothetical protein J467_4532, partial [Acinetobacter baumannii 916567]